MTSIAFDELFEVSQRFTRSVSVTRDFAKADALNGYILTQTGRGVLHRLASALKGDSSTRAWSFTGPYGAGKSAFALFVAQLLGGVDESGRKAAALLREQDLELHDSYFAAGGALAKKGMKLCPVLVTGSRGSIETAIARGLAQALRRYCPRGRPPQRG
jgi:hypothetical protein